MISPPFINTHNQNREARIDLTDTIVGITYPHDAVHRDVIVHASDYATTVATARNYLIVPAAGFDAHMVFSVTCNQATRIQVYEATVTTAAGTAITRARLNRNSARAINVAITVGPTITSDGTLLQDAFNGGGGSGANAFGGQVIHDDAEWVMKAGTAYMVRVTPVSSATLGIAFEWYEVAV